MPGLLVVAQGIFVLPCSMWDPVIHPRRSALGVWIIREIPPLFSYSFILPAMIYSFQYRTLLHLSFFFQKSKVFIVLQTLLKRDLIEKIYKTFNSFISREH